MQFLTQYLPYVWAFPTTALGLALLIAGLLTGARAQIHEGVLEVWGGGVSFFLRHFTLLKGGASAMTLGHVVLARSRMLLDITRSHERIHVRQCERWGPLFLPAYVIASALAFLHGRHPYRDNRFEVEAYENE